MADTTRRNPLLPWIIGLVIIIAADIYIGRLFFGGACAAPGIAQFMILIVLPAVYLALMYLTLKSNGNNKS